MGVRYKIDTSFFNVWTPAMAYVLGFIYADGSIDRSPKIRASYLSVTSTDQEIIVKIRRALRAEHRIRELRFPGTNRRPQYLLRIGSNHLCDALERHGVYPNKSLTAQLPSLSSPMLRHFVRGYFDGDGCVHIEQQKQKKTLRLRIIFTSGSKRFLTQLEAALRTKLSLKQRMVYVSHRSFQLSYSSKDSKALFDFMYKNQYDGLCLYRKKKIFEQYFNGLVVKW